jgi:3-hydroxymyristoyl/3-hydroxydecanoyl-(acyl carrier protein) dehydratase
MTPLTPHGPGFRFIDRFEQQDTSTGTGWKTLDPDLPFFADHFPGRPLMPAVLLVECAAQTAGVLWMKDSTQPDTPLFLAGIDQFRILGPVAPGQTLETRVTLIKELGALAQFESESRIGERAVARGRFMMSRQLAEA